MMKFRLSVLVGFTLFMAVLVLTAHYRSGQNLSAESRKVESPPIVNAVTMHHSKQDAYETYYGVVRPRASWTLAFQLSGLMRAPHSEENEIKPDQRTFWQEGDIIAKNKIVARLKDDQYQAMIAASKAQIASANASINVHRATISQLRSMVMASKASLAETQTRVEDARLEIKRLNDLEEIGGSLIRERERAQVQLTSSQAMVRQAQAQLAASEATLRSSEAQLSVLANNVTGAEAVLAQHLAQLSDTVVRAPTDVMVSQVTIEPGQMVAPGQTFIHVHEWRIVHVQIGVSDKRLHVIKPGQSATITIDAIDRSIIYQGKVAIISPAANPHDGLFHIEIAIDNTQPNKPRLLPGMMAIARLKLEPVQGYIIPEESVIVPETVAESSRQKQVQQPYVYMLKPNNGASLSQEKEKFQATTIKVLLDQPLKRFKHHYLLDEKPANLNHLVVQGQNQIEDDTEVDAYLLPVKGINQPSPGKRDASE